jgi:hypothetical protein
LLFVQHWVVLSLSSILFGEEDKYLLREWIPIT